MAPITVFISTSENDMIGPTPKRRIELPPSFPVGAMISLKVLMFCSAAEISSTEFLQLRFSDGITVQSITDGKHSREDCIQLPANMMGNCSALPVNVVRGRITQPYFSVELLKGIADILYVYTDYNLWLQLDVDPEKSTGSTKLLS